MPPEKERREQAPALQMQFTTKINISRNTEKLKKTFGRLKGTKEARLRMRKRREREFSLRDLRGVFDRVRTLPYTGWIPGFHSSSLEDMCIRN